MSFTPNPESGLHLLEQLRQSLGIERADFCGALGIPPSVYRWHLRNKHAITSAILNRIYEHWGIDADQMLLGAEFELYETNPEIEALIDQQPILVRSTIMRIAEALYALAEVDGMLSRMASTSPGSRSGTPGDRIKMYRERAGWSQRRTSEAFGLGRNGLREIEQNKKPISEAVLRAAWRHWRIPPGNICHGFSRVAAKPGEMGFWQILSTLPRLPAQALLRAAGLIIEYAAEGDGRT